MFKLSLIQSVRALAMKELLLLNESKLIGALLADMLKSLFPTASVRFATSFSEANRQYPDRDFGFVLADLESAGASTNSLVTQLENAYPNARLAFLSHKCGSDPFIHNLTDKGHICLSKETPYKDLLFSLRNILKSTAANQPRISNPELDLDHSRSHPGPK